MGSNGSGSGGHLEKSTARQLLWTSHRAFQGWTCSQCEWNYPLPTFLGDADARAAYDRLAASQFRDHQCSQHILRAAPPQEDEKSFTARVRKLISQGFKPKDAVELMVQEVELEYRSQPATVAKARLEGEDFLRRMRAGML